MNIYIISKKDFPLFVEKLITTGDVVGVTQKENKYVFAPLKNSQDLVLDYDVTLLSPKKYLYPQYENLISFKLKPEIEVEETSTANSLTIIGVHPYDLRAINQLDRLLLSGDHPDTNYLKRQLTTTIIGVTPKQASKWAFWSYIIDAYQVHTGFDLMLTDIGKKYVVEVGSDEGEILIQKYTTAQKAETKDIKKMQKAKQKLAKMCSKKRSLKTSGQRIPDLLKNKEDSKVWEEQAEKCYSCGSCNIICPTCFCFDVHEEIDLAGNQGRRYRTWDGCLLHDFTKIGSGEVFRKQRKERFKHRFYRKYLYLEKELNELACVGCGRCASVCLPDIADPVQVLNKLAKE
ncbi:MAG: 4Fe-4S dicluster domain-containing protein [Pseudomonadota bacterium]